MSRPIISVIIPAYNESDGILGCLESISAQTFDDFEIIVVDDGSKDNTVKVCEDYAEREPRLRVIKKVNGGVSSARNAGLRVARGEYYYFADADDFVLPTCFELLIEQAESKSSDVVVADFFIRSGSRKSRVKQEPFADSSELLETIISGINHSGLWNKIFRRSLFKELSFSDQICYLEDRVLLSEMLLKYKPKVSFLESPVYIYSVNPKSASNWGGSVLLQTLVAHERISYNLAMYEAPEEFLRQHHDAGYRNAWYVFRNIRSECLDDALAKLSAFVDGLQRQGWPKPKGYTYVTLDFVLRLPAFVRLGVAKSLRGLFSLVSSSPIRIINRR